MENDSGQRLLIYFLFYFLGLKNNCGTASYAKRLRFASPKFLPTSTINGGREKYNQTYINYLVLSIIKEEENAT